MEDIKYFIAQAKTMTFFGWFYSLLYLAGGVSLVVYAAQSYAVTLGTAEGYAALTWAHVGVLVALMPLLFATDSHFGLKR